MQAAFFNKCFPKCIFVEILFETVVKVKSSSYFYFCPCMRVSGYHQTSPEWHTANQKLGWHEFHQLCYVYKAGWCGENLRWNCEMDGCALHYHNKKFQT